MLKAPIAGGLMIGIAVAATLAMAQTQPPLHRAEAAAQLPFPAGFSIPLLSAPGPGVAAGERAFGLTWRGGNPPFSVVLTDQPPDPPGLGPAPRPGDPPRTGPMWEMQPYTVLLGAEGLREPRLPPQRVMLAPGFYRVTVTEAAGYRVAAIFRVVSLAEVPMPPSDARHAGLTEAEQETAGAVWLAAQDNRAWMFESWLRVLSVSEHYGPAQALAEALANGDVPPIASPQP
ncbi:MAG: hypothetical protein GC191_17145 [Azospirillum sp.]|nr:hypothetical protein [Azospirillum sp.]